MNEPATDQDLAAERAAAPTLAAKYDAACRSVADLHAQLMSKQEHLRATAKALDEVRARIPHHGRVDQKQAADLVPDADALVGPAWMHVAVVEKRSGMLRVHGWTTVDPTKTVSVRPAPGTPASAQRAMEELGIDEDDE